MKYSIYNLGGSSVPLPSLPLCFMKFGPCFVPFGTLEEVFRVFIPMSATSWELKDGPYSSLFHDCACWNFSGGKYGRPYLSGPRGSLCGELKRDPVYKMVSVLVESGYLVPVFQKRGEE